MFLSFAVGQFCAENCPNPIVVLFLAGFALFELVCLVLCQILLVLFCTIDLLRVDVTVSYIIVVLKV
jgi:hypothetical protein